MKATETIPACEHIGCHYEQCGREPVALDLGRGQYLCEQHVPEGQHNCMMLNAGYLGRMGALEECINMAYQAAQSGEDVYGPLDAATIVLDMLWMNTEVTFK